MATKLEKIYKFFIFSMIEIAMVSFCCIEKAQNAKIIFYHQGQETILNPGSSEFRNLKKSAEGLLVTADDMLRLIVEPELIDKIKKTEIAIEIIYPKPITLTLNYNKNTIHPDHILIPLSGEFVGQMQNPPAVVFHGYPDYSSGPYRNSKGIMEVQKILLDMGLK